MQSTLFAASKPLPPEARGLAPLFDGARVFDVCHVGLVLRALMGVQTVMALGLALQARDFAGWALSMASGTVVTLPAVLSWLLLVCASRRLLARLKESVQWALLAVLGALCASLGWQMLMAASLESSGNFRLMAVAMCGAAAAAVLLQWLKLREREQRPAAALAQLVELQSRIRPHFLFNTLNTALALVRVDPDQAERVLEDLSELFRVALAEADSVVSLDEELALAQRYLAIEQIRFGDRLRVRWRLDAHAHGARLPPLLLQPLVENAVRHGVEPNDEGGELEVLTRKRGSEVEIRISNSVGRPSHHPGHGIALANVRERLRLMHDLAARFEVVEGADRFVVKMVLPLSAD